MNHISNKLVVGSIILLCTLAFSAIALAQFSGGDFTITKNTIDSGGGVSTGGDYKITGTIGQADASEGSFAGGPYRLAGGFWANSAASVIGNEIFKDSFEGN